MARKRLEEAEIEQRLVSLPHWAREGDALVRTVECESYPAACALLLRVAFAAEKRDHHPDVQWSYRKVRFTLSTHDLGGISELDFLLAGDIDALVGAS